MAVPIIELLRKAIADMPEFANNIFVSIEKHGQEISIKYTLHYISSKKVIDEATKETSKQYSYTHIASSEEVVSYFPTDAEIETILKQLKSDQRLLINRQQKISFPYCDNYIFDFDITLKFR